MIQGSMVAIVTPMHEDGSLDLAAFRGLIDFHVAQGTDGIVVVGTTGESPTVDVAEHELLIAEAVKHAAKRIPIIAGTGANSTKEAIELASFSKRVGADASLTVVPYYNKPTQEGLYLHFKTIAEAVDMPHILYNVPGRTVADLSNDTVLRLAQIPNIVGIKDATGNIERGSDLLQRAALLKRAHGDGTGGDFAIYSGDDASTLALMLLGAHGTISVTANVAPRLMHEMCVAALNGEVGKAREINYRLLGLHRHLFVEANPIPVKWAVARLGQMKNSLRLPLTPLSPSAYAVVEAAMRQAGVLAQ
ncbi:MAG: 4-hydroxy-tetrahydrodipicolinate synthase [Nitrosomonadales bacterium]|nr:4-hydroxy-tetrahydrodipicolinate synthase [Nitrosomonadales bacterium]